MRWRPIGRITVRPSPANPQSEIDSFDIERDRGAILLDSLRRGMGDDRFFDLMRDFFAANTTKAVSAQAFVDKAGTTATMPNDPGGPRYTSNDIGRRLASAWIVYGTTTEASANRYAAEQLQKHLLDRLESAVPVRKDFEVSEADMKDHDVIFIGRPETNSALAGFRARLDLDYTGGNFRLNGKDHASETQGLILATANPLDDRHMFLIMAGNSALETVHLAAARPGRFEFSINDAGTDVESGFRAGLNKAPAGGFSQR